MYAKIAVVVIVALVGVASAANSTCSVQSEIPVLKNPTFRAYVQLNDTNSYLPLEYIGHSSGYDHPIRGISIGKAEIKTNCAEIHTSLVVDEANQTMFYDLQWMSFSDGKSKKICTLGHMMMKNRADKYYSCKDADEERIATLVIERVNMKEESICQLTPDPVKLCPFIWVEGGEN